MLICTMEILNIIIIIRQILLGVHFISILSLSVRKFVFGMKVKIVLKKKLIDTVLW